MAQSTYSLSFAGSDYVTAGPGALPSSATPSGTDGSEISISLWVKYTDASANYCLLQQEPVNSRFLLFTQSSSLVWRGNSNGGGGANELTASSPSSGVWHHIAATLKNYISGVQFSNAHLYVDGVEVATGGPTDLAHGSCIMRFASGAGDIDLGRFVDIAAFGLNGLLDDVAIFDTVLDPADVAAIANGSLDASTLSPVYLWRLEAGSGGTAADTSGGGHNGTITGATWSSDVPAPLAGSPPPPPSAVDQTPIMLACLLGA